MSAITTHILDAVAGKPAAGVSVTLEYKGPDGEWEFLAQRQTGADGRVHDFLPEAHALKPGFYALRFDTAGLSGFFPEVVLRFKVDNTEEHYHVPLLLGPFSYTTYRGS